MAKKVNYARFHQSLYHPSIGDIGPQLPAMAKKLENLHMEFDELGLSVAFSYDKKDFNFLIPSANITHLSLLPDAKLEAKLKVQK